MSQTAKVCRSSQRAVARAAITPKMAPRTARPFTVSPCCSGMKIDTAAGDIADSQNLPFQLTPASALCNEGSSCSTGRSAREAAAVDTIAGPSRATASSNSAARLTLPNCSGPRDARRPWKEGQLRRRPGITSGDWRQGGSDVHALLSCWPIHCVSG